MRILGKKWWTLAAALPVAALIACSSDSPVEIILPSGEVVSEEEYEELVEEGKIDEMGNLVVEDEDDDDGDAAGSDTQKSSSSKAGTSSSPTDSKTSASSTDSGDSGDATSSASKDESSSVGSEGTSSEGGSGNTAESSSSASGVVTSSSSTVRQATLSDGDGNFSMGTDDMEEVASGTQSELDSLKEILDNGGTVEGFEELATEFDENTLTYESFDEGDYYCFTGEGEWMHVTRELLGQYIPHYKNGQAWGNLRHFDVKFMDACEGVYFRRKS